MKTRVALVLDCSGSMSYIQNKAKQVFNQMVVDHVENANRYGLDGEITLITFSRKANIVYAAQSLKNPIDSLLLKDYCCDGTTSLFDAVGLAINTLKTNKEKPGDAYIVMVVTDGHENSSRNYTGHDIKILIDKLNKKDNWTFTFQLPPNHGKSFASNCALSLDNVREWSCNEKGFSEVSHSNSMGLANYYNVRSKGITRVDNFYVNVDISDLTKTKVKQKLDNISDYYICCHVTYDSDIKSFIERMGVVYKKGCAFYQLTKREIVQATKDILVREKGKSEIYGGLQARNLIGLPQNASAKVNPVDLGKWEVFVRSTSVNRKLVPGTKVMVEK